jgi:hypothetical protein
MKRYMDETMSIAIAKIRRFIWPALAAMTLTACDASTIISKVDIAHNYQPISLGRFHGGENGLRIVGYGSPFGDPPAQVADAVVAGMQGHNGGPRVTFSAAAAPPPRPRWRVVMALNPTDVRDTNALCKLTDTPTTTRSQDGRLRILAAFCQGDWVASQATARGKDITSLNSPNFDNLLAGLTRELFPSRNPHDDRRRRCRVLPCL